ncbi:MAG: hypothetical protein M3326_00440 [Actinomycetota bacterium]|nr:hypothetical protein [Actinomycetota bacterium]
MVTTPLAPTTTVAPVTTTAAFVTTTTEPLPTTTSLPPATTTPTTTPTTAPPVPPEAPSLDAVNPVGDRSGPPGVGLEVSGGGYAGCKTVYFFFDGVRIGTDTPDASGFVGAEGLSVPGDAKTGPHRVTSSCSSSGGPVRASTTFVVTAADVHRSAFVTSLNQPDQVSLDLGHLAASAAAAMGILLLFAFPYELFNSTVEENYDEIRGWFRLPARAVEAASGLNRTVAFFVLTVAASIALGFLSPDFGLNAASAVLVIGFTAAMVIMSLAFSLPAAFLIHRRAGEWGKLNFLPGSLLISIVMVVASRLLAFQPGYFYGAMAGLAFASVLSKDVEGKVTAANWIWALVLSVGAWFASIPVSAAAEKPDASAWWIGVEACLVLIFLWGLESVAVAMLPMRFLDGRKVIDWNRVVWAVLMFLGVFAAVHILLSPNSGYVGHTNGEVAIGVLVLFAAFGAISVGLWAYFRYRPRRWIPKRIA